MVIRCGGEGCRRRSTWCTSYCGALADGAVLGSRWGGSILPPYRRLGRTSPGCDVADVLSWGCVQAHLGRLPVPPHEAQMGRQDSRASGVCSLALSGMVVAVMSGAHRCEYLREIVFARGGWDGRPRCTYGQLLVTWRYMVLMLMGAAPSSVMTAQLRGCAQARLVPSPAICGVPGGRVSQGV